VGSAMAPFAAKINALEKASMPPPPVSTAPRFNRVDDPGSAPPAARPHAAREPPPAAPTATAGEGAFIPVTRNRKRKSTVGANAATLAPFQPAILTPASYAGRAATAANTRQPPAPPKKAPQPPTITEITVLRSGGHADPIIEEGIIIRPADHIVREVKQIMAGAVPNPIPLKAGRWSMHPRSKGNFVYSFDGNVPFDKILTYQRILLHPFKGSGQLSPSMGWTRLLAHGVPVWDEDGEAFSPEAILAEVTAMPGLKKAHFAMAPRWLKPLGAIDFEYSTLTFAISDPDGAITDTLLKGRAALFGKETVIKRWVDKPILVQCSHCHALGHTKASRACRLAKDSVRCHICGGAHNAEQHNQRCPRLHAVAGICDCKHFKCLNCLKTGHDCRNKLCPARDNFRPRTGHKPRRPRGRGRAREVGTETGPARETPAEEIPAGEIPAEEANDPDGDLYALPPPPAPRTSPRPRIVLPTTAAVNPPATGTLTTAPLEVKETLTRLSPRMWSSRMQSPSHTPHHAPRVALPHSP
jgi:hypothetical protein